MVQLEVMVLVAQLVMVTVQLEVMVLAQLVMVTVQTLVKVQPQVVEAKSREAMCFRLFPQILASRLFSEAHSTMTPIFSVLVPFHLIFVLLFKHIDM
jgi:hypothetical protein